MKTQVRLIVVLVYLASTTLLAAQKSYLRHIIVDGHELTWQAGQVDTFQIDHPEHLVFVFDTLPKGTKVYYQLTNYNKKRRRLKAAAAIYSMFRRGVYTFHVWTDRGNGKELVHSSYFEVDGPIVGSWWFMPLLGIYLLFLFGGALYFIMLSNFRSKQKFSDVRIDWTNKLHNDIGGDLSSVSLRMENH